MELKDLNTNLTLSQNKTKPPQRHHDLEFAHIKIHVAFKTHNQCFHNTRKKQKWYTLPNLLYAVQEGY